MANEGALVESLRRTPCRHRRVPHTVWAFLPWGALPLLGLAGVCLFGATRFARNWIESPLRHHVRGQLDSNHLEMVRVDVNGQDVVLSGSLPNAEDGPRAVRLAEAAACPSWAGALDCTRTVVGRFDSAPVSTSPAPDQSKPALDLKQVQACEDDLARVLSSAPIEFDTGRAVVRPASAGLLDRVAEAAKTCPGTLRVEGHTDNVGAEASNVTLSQARAQAIREALEARGLDPGRLVAQGFGQARPIADNGTPDGRARNRRIEIHVVRD